MSMNSRESTRFIAALGNETTIPQDQALWEIKSFLQIYSVNENIQLGHSSLQQPPLYWVLSTILWDFDSVYPRILILLEHGAELNVLYKVNSVVTTPLHLVMTKLLESEDSNTISLGRLLVSNGADPNFQAEVCPLLCDCLELHYRSVDIIVFLMEIGTNPNQFGKRGWTALMFLNTGAPAFTCSRCLIYASSSSMAGCCVCLECCCAEQLCSISGCCWMVARPVL